MYAYMYRHWVIYSPLNHLKKVQCNKIAKTEASKEHEYFNTTLPLFTWFRPLRTYEKVANDWGLDGGFRWVLRLYSPWLVMTKNENPNPDTYYMCLFT